MSARRGFSNRTGTAIVLVWTGAAVVTAIQRAVADGLAGHDPTSFWRVLAVQAALLWPWAAATPGILWSARRFPVAGVRRLPNLALHVAAGSAFVFVYNVMIRLAGAPAGPADSADLWRGSMHGFATWYHLAMTVYLAVVAVGHRHLLRSDRARGGAGDGGTDRHAGGDARGDAPDDDDAGRRPDGRGADRDVAPAPGGPTRPAGPRRLAVRAGAGIRLIPTDEIDWIEADDNHVCIHAGDRAHRVRARLGELGRRLDDAGFVRIHRSLLVRAAAVRELRPADRGDYTVVLHNGRELRLARTRAAALDALVGGQL